jgi:hypothetical protein
MKHFLISACILLLLLDANLYAQDFNIRKIDNTNYPFIKVYIEFPGIKKTNCSNLHLLEFGDTLTVTIDSLPYPDNDKAICLLLGPELLSSEENCVSLKEIMNNITFFSSEGDKINILTLAKKANKPICLIPVSFEFSPNFKEFSEYFFSTFEMNSESEESPINDSIIKKALYFINGKKTLPINKLLLIISNQDENSINNRSDIIKKANKQGILVHWLNPFSQIKKQNLNKAANQQYMLELLDSIFSKKSMTSPIDKKLYSIGFYTNQKAKLNSFEIEYRGRKEKGTFTRPEHKSYFRGNSILLIIIGILILTIFCLILILKRTNNYPNASGNNKTGNLLSKISWKRNPISKKSIKPNLTIEIKNEKICFELTKALTTIGRHEDNDIFLNDLTISGHHATILFEDGQYFIQDNVSTNGTYVNDLKISKVTLKNGDIMKLGKARMVINF